MTQGTLTRGELARMIDHTALSLTATPEDITRLCHEAAEYQMASVCVRPDKVVHAVDVLRGTGIPVCTVIAFHTGEGLLRDKALEAQIALQRGASEFDMVVRQDAMDAEDWRIIEDEVRAVDDVVFAQGGRVKVILETRRHSLLTIARACKTVRAVLGDRPRNRRGFVKTCTGFYKVGDSVLGATEDHVSLMKATVGDDLEVKASAGIRTYADARAMVRAGATRIGASASIAILQGAPA